MIRYENGAYHYFDRNGTELHDGDTVRYESGETQKLYLTENGLLGTDATNPVWIADLTVCENCTTSLIRIAAA